MTIDNEFRAMIENVFSELKENEEIAASATAISKMVGYSKKNDKVCQAIDYLLDAGLLEVASDEPYIIYRLVDDASLDDLIEILDEDETPYESSELQQSSQDVLEGSEATSLNTFPEDPMGYIVEETRDGYLITFPGSTTKHRLAKDERLLVINGTHRAVVKHPEDILSEFAYYTEENGIHHFTVTNIVTGSCVSTDNVKSEFDVKKQIVFHVTISRHNKAGA